MSSVPLSYKFYKQDISSSTLQIRKLKSTFMSQTSLLNRLGDGKFNLVEECKRAKLRIRYIIKIGIPFKTKGIMGKITNSMNKGIEVV